MATLALPAVYEQGERPAARLTPPCIATTATRDTNHCITSSPNDAAVVVAVVCNRQFFFMVDFPLYTIIKLSSEFPYNRGGRNPFLTSRIVATTKKNDEEGGLIVPTLDRTVGYFRLALLLLLLRCSRSVPFDLAVGRTCKQYNK